MGSPGCSPKDQVMRVTSPSTAVYIICKDILEVGDQVVVVVSMRSGQRCILRCEAANTAAGTSTILAK